MEIVADTEHSANTKTVAIPKYDNYMRNQNTWNTVKSQLLNLQSDSSYRVQYTVYNLRKERIERKQLLALNLMWGTELKMFSNVFSLLIEDGSPESSREETFSVNSEYPPSYSSTIKKIVIFTDTIEKPANKLHCVSALDHQFWSTIDCETEYEEAIYDGQEIEVKCSCDGGSDASIGGVEEADPSKLTD